MVKKIKETFCQINLKSGQKKRINKTNEDKKKMRWMKLNEMLLLIWFLCSFSSPPSSLCCVWPSSSPPPRLCVCCCSSLLTADTIMLVSGLYFHRCDDFERQFVISFTPSPIFPHYFFLQTLIQFILNTMQFQSSEIDYIGA